MADRPETGDNDGAYQSSLTIRVYPREGAGRDDVRPAVLEDLRARLGDEVVDRLLRARQLLLNPRPLSEEEGAELDAVMDPVLVWAARFGPMGERLAALAEQVQAWEVEALAAAGRPATWPECPEHPDSHPLEPGVEASERGVWRCPRSRRVVSAIGELGR